MVKIVPIKGFRYNQEKIELEKVVAPPYDVISLEQQNELYETSPYNVVRLILGREEDRYSSAARHYKKWREESILIQDGKPVIYLLAQNFAGNEEKQITRKGFIGGCELVEFDKGVVLPHEKTLSKPKADRFNLMKETAANFSQIFGLYADPEKKLDELAKPVMNRKAAIDVNFEGVNNKIWMIDDEDEIKTIQNYMIDKKILIADGHHRYETALAYRDLRKSQNPSHTGNEPYNYVMMFVTNMYDEGLVIYPTHRVLHSLSEFNGDRFVETLRKYYTVNAVANESELKETLQKIQQYGYGLVLPDKFYLISLDGKSKVNELLPSDIHPSLKELDVTLLHVHILTNLLKISRKAQEEKLYLDYVKDFDETVKAVKSGKAQAAFLMNHTPIEQVRAVAESGNTMPQKSTYFYPKLVSGLVINPLD